MLLIRFPNRNIGLLEVVFENAVFFEVVEVNDAIIYLRVLARAARYVYVFKAV